jgi:pyruvate formate lyase activating enzyme
MREIKGTIFDIKRFAVHDGPGIRTTVFFKGCPLKCWWCANPEGQNPYPEEILSLFNKNSEGICTKEIIGREITAKEVMNELSKDRVFYEESEGGITFSGGEPLMQSVFLLSLLSLCKEESFHTALDTSGYAPKDILEEILDKVDLFLYDLKLLNDEEHIKYTGVSLDLILDNLLYLCKKKKEIIIRIPIIPGITDSLENIGQIGEYISKLKCISRVDILPFNKMGEAKYRRLEKPYMLNNVTPPSEERMNEIKKQLEAFDLSVKIGG